MAADGAGFARCHRRDTEHRPDELSGQRLRAAVPCGGAGQQYALVVRRGSLTAMHGVWPAKSHCPVHGRDRGYAAADEGGGWLQRACGSCNLRGECSPGIACPSSDRQGRQPIFGPARVTTLTYRLVHRLSNLHADRAFAPFLRPAGAPLRKALIQRGKHVFLQFRGLLPRRFVHTACTRGCEDLSPIIDIRQGEAGGERPVRYRTSVAKKRTFVQATELGGWMPVGDGKWPVCFRVPTPISCSLFRRGAGGSDARLR